MKDTEEDIREWKYLTFSWTDRTNIVRMAILAKAIYRFNTISIKTPTQYITKTERTIISFIWKHSNTYTQIPPHTHSKISKQSKVEERKQSRA